MGAPWSPRLRQTNFPGDPTYRGTLDTLMPLAADESSPAWGSERVYAFHAPQLGRVKIGYSGSPKRRLAVVGAKVPGVLVGWLNGGDLVESVLHEKFAEHRIEGEWFDDVILPELQVLIDADVAHYGRDPIAV